MRSELSSKIGYLITYLVVCLSLVFFAARCFGLKDSTISLGHNATYDGQAMIYRSSSADTISIGAATSTVFTTGSLYALNGQVYVSTMTLANLRGTSGTFTGTLYVNNLTISGSTNLGTVTLTDSATLTDLIVTNEATIASSTIMADQKIGNDLRVYGNLLVDSYSTLTGVCNIIGYAYGSSLTLSQDLYVEGKSYFVGDVRTYNDLRADGGIVADSASITNNMAVGTDLTVADDASIVDDLSVGGDLDVTETGTFGGVVTSIITDNGGGTVYMDASLEVDDIITTSISTQGLARNMTIKSSDELLLYGDYDGDEVYSGVALHCGTTMTIFTFFGPVTGYETGFGQNDIVCTPIHIFGNNKNSGGISYIWNSANEDSVINYYVCEAQGTSLTFGTNTNLDQLSVSNDRVEVDDNLVVGGDLTVTGSISGSSISGNITMADDSWIGLGASAGRIVFDDQTTDEVNFMGCNVGIGTATPSYILTIAQSADNNGLRLYGYDDRASDYSDLCIGSDGRTYLNSSSGILYLQTAGATRYAIGSTRTTVYQDFRIQDNNCVAFGSDDDYCIGYNSSDDTLRIADGANLTGSPRITMDSSGNVGINDTTPSYSLDVNGTLAANKALLGSSRQDYSWDVSAKLEAYWNLNELSGTHVDDSQENHDGVASKDITNFTSTGKLGTSFEFDQSGSDEFTSCGTSNDLNYENDFAIEAWIYVNDTEAPIVSRIESQGGISGEGYVVGIDSSDHLYIRCDYAGDTVTGSTTVTNNTWMHVVVSVSSGGLASLYVNGDLDTSDYITIETTPSNQIFYIGYEDYSTEFFNGKIDNVRVYNAALTSDEVIFLYNNGDGTTANAGTIELNVNGSAYIADLVYSSGYVTLCEPSTSTYPIKRIIDDAPLSDESISSGTFDIDGAVCRYEVQANPSSSAHTMMGFDARKLPSWCTRVRPDGRLGVDVIATLAYYSRVLERHRRALKYLKRERDQMRGELDLSRSAIINLRNRVSALENN